MPAAAENPIVCYVTGGEAAGGTKTLQTLRERIQMAIAAGIDWVQIREKNLAARGILDITRESLTAAQAFSAEGRAGVARILVNDRLDVALAAGGAGVHLGHQSLPAKNVVRWCRGGNAPAEFLVGVSCHSVAEVREAEADGASYVFFGPVFETPSKMSFGPPQGIARLREACHAVRIPVIGIGGVNQENAAECMQAGARGVAAIRMFQEARDLRTIRDAIARLHRGV